MTETERRVSATEIIRTQEVIDGRRVQIWSYPAGARRQTGAQWEAPAAHLRGEVGSQEGLDLHFVIFRTLRFERP